MKLHGALIEIDETTGRAFSIERVAELYQRSGASRGRESVMALCEAAFFQPRAGPTDRGECAAAADRAARAVSRFLLVARTFRRPHELRVRRTSLERYAEGLPLIVVMPNGGRGFYTDAEQGFAYETALVRELIPFIDRMFNTRTDRGGRCIGGLSMGGYGAIKLALKYPDLFGSANSHSGALTKGHIRRAGETEEFDRIFGPTAANGTNDIFALAEKIDRAKLPAVRIDCGTEDFLIERSREFHAYLESLHLAHEYAEFPGDHEWSYWDEHVQEALAFHCRQLGIQVSE